MTAFGNRDLAERHFSMGHAGNFGKTRGRTLVRMDVCWNAGGRCKLARREKNASELNLALCLAFSLDLIYSSQLLLRKKNEQNGGRPERSTDRRTDGRPAELTDLLVLYASERTAKKAAMKRGEENNGTRTISQANNTRQISSGVDSVVSSFSLCRPECLTKLSEN